MEDGEVDPSLHYSAKDFGKESFKDVTYDEILDKFFSWFYAGVDAEN